MEANNTNQPLSSVQTPVQPSQHPIKNHRGHFLIILGVLLLLLVVGSGAYYLGAQKKSPTNQVINNTLSPSSISTDTKKSHSPTVDTKNGVIVKIVDGDIVVTQNGKDTKITSWGYNSDPAISPDGTKIAYISKSKESIENEKIDQGFKRISTNVWVVNSDGSGPLQVTNHINFVYRSHPHWLDVNRILFVDGEQSVRVYNTKTKESEVVLGTEKTVQACLDACGFETRFFYSPDYIYLVRLSSGGGGVAVSSKTAVLNTQTLESSPINEAFGVDFDTVSFPSNNTLTFEGSELPNFDKKYMVTINLSTAQVTKH